MASILRRTKALFRRAPTLALQFPSSGFRVISDSEVLEEEQFSHFKEGRYYPVCIGDILASKYQVLGKLGFGVSFTVWLGRNLKHHQFVALKIFINEGSGKDDLEIQQHITEHANRSHPGFSYVRTTLDTFTINHHGAEHICLVQTPMWDGFKDLIYRNSTHRFSEVLLKAGLMQIFLALDYLHSECKLVHTGSSNSLFMLWGIGMLTKYQDIKPDNILQVMEYESILNAFVQDEMENPSPRKIVDSFPIFASRQFRSPREFGRAVLRDFSSAVRGDVKNNDDVQPNVYRSPEVMLRTEWSYPIDIWNVGVMVWGLFEGKHMFNGEDPNGEGYSTRAHLAEVIGVLGPPPSDLVKRGVRSHEFFTEEGQWKADMEIPPNSSLEASEQFLEGENKEMFLRFMRGMLQWRPEDRKTARQLLDDPWLKEV